VLLLCGGQGSRLGGCDKAALPSPTAPNRSLLADAIDRYGCVGPIWIASGPSRRSDLPPEQLQLLDPPLTETAGPAERAGPLAGLYAGMTHALTRADRSILLSCPVDLVGLRAELLWQLVQAIQARPRLQVLVAQRALQAEPLVAAWRVDAGLLESVHHALRRGERAVYRCQQSLRQASYPVPAEEPEWINLNTATELARVFPAGFEQT
jgi:molybdopterin-guanine dinucleotide biosynthesis protein A